MRKHRPLSSQTAEVTARATASPRPAELTPETEEGDTNSSNCRLGVGEEMAWDGA